MSLIEKYRLILQHDWNEVLMEADGKAWITFRKPGIPSIYSDLTSRGMSTNGLPFVTSEDERFSVLSITRRSTMIAFKDPAQGIDIKSIFHAPHAIYAGIHRPKKSVLCLDVANGGIGVSSDNDGHLTVWNSNEGNTLRQLTGHAGDVYTCRFFPSGIVVLTGGADTRLKIWSPETGHCAATLTGHRAGVSDTAIVEVGRNVVSVSRDGQAKLWDCGQSACLATIEPGCGELNACCLGSPTQLAMSGSAAPSSDREVLTEGKMLVVAAEKKCLLGYCLRSRTKMFELPCSDAVNCCAFLGPMTVCCGTQDSCLYYIDLRNPLTPLHVLKEKRSAILSLHCYQEGLLVATGDGSCYMVGDGRDAVLELTGSDCDPIYKVAYNSQFIYTGCRDGSIRKYKL